MVMFKTKFTPWGASDKPQAQQQQQPQPPMPKPRQEEEEKAPPIEKERGPQYPVKEPGPRHEPERVRSERAR